MAWLPCDVRTRGVATLAAAWLIAIAPTPARAQPPEVVLSSCPQLDASEVHRLLAVELGAQPGAPAWLLARCEGLALTWTAAAPGAVARERRIDLGSEAPEVRDRVAALAAAELYRRLHEPTPPAPPPADSPREPPQPPRAPVPHPPWQLVVGVEGRSASPSGTLAFGPGLSVLRRLKETVAAELVLAGGAAQTLTRAGGVSVAHARLAALMHLTWYGPRASLRLGAGAAGGVARLRGEPAREDLVGRSALAALAGPCVALAWQRKVAGSVGVEARAELGHHLAGIEALAGGDAVARLSGAWVSARLGVTTP